MTSAVKGCDYAECNVPPERHEVCAAAGLGKCWGRLEHQHVPKRSQGGKECPVRLCTGHHGCIDDGARYEGYRLSNCVHDGVYYIRCRDTGEVLREIPL